MTRIKRHVAVIKEANLKIIEGTGKYRLVLLVSMYDKEKPHLLNYEMDSLENLQHKFEFSETDIKSIVQRKCIVNDNNNVYSFANFI